MSFEARNITQGGQVIKYMISMFMQIINIVVYYSLLPSILAFFGFIFWSMKWINIKHGLVYAFTKYVKFKFFAKTSESQVYQFEWVNTQGEVFQVTRKYSEILHDKYFIDCFELLKQNAFYAWGISILVFLSIIGIAMWYLGRTGRLQRSSDKVGGRSLAKVKEVNSLLRSQGKLSHLKIGDLHIVKNSEVQNFGLHGTVGTGKSTVINSLLWQAKEAGQRGVIYDKGNNFIPIFYREGKDVILNPMDERCPNWDLWAECQDKADFENFAQPLLPESKGGDPFWVLSARMLFVSTAEAMRKDPDRSIRKLLDNLLSISLADLREYLANTDASSLVEGSIEKTAITIRTVLGSYARALRVCQGLEGNGKRKFSIREWIQNSDDDAWIFLSSDGRIHETIKPLITAWLNITMQNVLALNADLQRRVWTMLDELNSLQKVPLILEYLSEARKFGGVTLLGLQSFAQLEKNYGKEEARAIWDLLNTKVYFRSPSGDVAEWVQHEIGETVVNKFRDQYSYGVDTIRDGVNFSKEETREHIVSYSDIQRLNDLQCYVSLLGDLPVVKVDLKRRDYPIVATGKIERDMSAVFDPTLEQKLDEVDNAQRHIDAIVNRVVGGAKSSGSNNGGTEVVIAPKEPEFNADGTLKDIEVDDEHREEVTAENIFDKNENIKVENNLKHSNKSNDIDFTI
ncbi:type IV conjugative transfer system coupling protein TraD [Glaesserella parasuis]|nr:type IV conjugative transfer system coupling protein TraD [Glaesserella parasuis 174]MCT8756563.1 type IV conjugative transfer system coupling protein TraD [Glaesserella parasuis]MDD2170378.1 type IV conjugative transfer system coupling protein TraD [Glaesserella parasuis]MDO9767942.1 type IV conjugative transfer system coupling protein TraD [Glaesserella parasuis]MDO9922517.1 type IV conjugative transfer system coupling protein TraD [Glaesserella parasuis]